MNKETKKKISSTLRSRHLTRDYEHRNKMSNGMLRGSELGGMSIAHLKRQRTILLKEYAITAEQHIIERIEEIEDEILYKEGKLHV